jgi:hypothetical protein
MKIIQNYWKILSDNRKEIFLVLPILLSLVFFSFLMRYRGWRSTPLGNADMLVYYLGAESMLHEGTVMEKGDLSSYQSYPPPGMVYLVLPAVALLKDPRLFSLPGDLLVNISSMVFLYLIFRQCAGRGLALAICVVYGFSRLVFMGIWPIGHPVYVLGMLWFLMQWVRKRSAGWLFGALVIGAFGLYVDLAILPFLFVFPALWILFRPPLRPIPILLACAIGLFIWIPYLHFETSRGFADLKSIFFLKPVPGSGEATHQTPTYCYAVLPGEMDSINETYIPYLGTGQGMDRVVFSEPGWEKYLQICRVLGNLDRNFDGGYFLTSNPVVAAGLWFLFLTGMFQSVGMALLGLEGKWDFLGRLRRMTPKILLGICLVGSLTLFVIMNPDLLGKISADGKLAQPARLVVEQLKYFAPLIFSACILGLYIGLRAPKRDLQDIAPLLIVWIPCLILVFVAEVTRSERFFWIWPLQVAVLVFAVFQIIGQFSKKVRWKFVAVLALATLVFPLSFYLPAIRDWVNYGFSGENNPQVQVVDFIHKDMNAAGTSNASIGYGFFPTHSAPAQPEDTRMRYGSWFDLLLETRWGIHNLNHDPAGMDNGDTWRILELESPSGIVPSPWKGFTPVAVFGPFVVYRAEEEKTILWPGFPYYLQSDACYSPHKAFLPSSLPAKRIYPFYEFRFF